ncbi:MAG: phosphatase PAP2 family protein [Candidatus Pacebacteria bacterium]|nr:phosphatase PAP2 family protein [Candidatus Paceibacterota bacterium]
MSEIGIFIYMNYDIKIFEIINGLAGKSGIADALGVFLAEYLAYVLALILIIAFLYSVKGRVMVIISLVAGFISRMLIKPAIVLLLARQRPYECLENFSLLIPVSVNDSLESFPSGHAIFFFAISTVVYNFNKKLGIFFFIASFLMGIARIFIGVHFPTDILAGAILGVLIGICINLIYKKYQQKIDSFILKYDWSKQKQC